MKKRSSCPQGSCWAGGAARSRIEITQAKDGMVQAKDGMVQAKDGMVQAKDGMVQAKDGMVHAKDGMVQAKDGMVQAKDGMFQAKDGMVHCYARRNAVMFVYANARCDHIRLSEGFHGGPPTGVQLALDAGAGFCRRIIKRKGCCRGG